MATASIHLPARCWRPVRRRGVAILLGGLSLATSAGFAARAEEPIPFVVATSHVEAPRVKIPPAPTWAPTPSVSPPAVSVREGPVDFISPAARAVVSPEQLINPLGGAPAAIPVASTIPSFVVPASRAPETPTALPVDLPVTLSNPAEVARPVAVIPRVEFTRAMDVPGVLDAADLAAAATPVNPAVLMQPAEEIVPPAGEPSDDDMDRRLYRPITQVTVNAALPEGLSPGQPGSEIEEPPSPPTPQFGDARLVGGWPMTDFQWSATGMYHKPLYFEEVNLERYGYTVSPVLQPLISGAHFFATIPVLPYKMTTHPPYECYYTLGHYRPGSCAPRRWHHEPWDPLAAAVEAGTVVGLIYIIP